MREAPTTGGAQMQWVGACAIGMLKATIRESFDNLCSLIDGSN